MAPRQKIEGTIGLSILEVGVWLQIEGDEGGFPANTLRFGEFKV